MKTQEIKKLETQILKTLKQHIKKSDTIILAISGGADSILLHHFLKQIPCKIILAHINHQLRGQESDLDQKLIETLDPKAEILKIDIKKISQEQKHNLEDLARIKRYQFFRKQAKKHQAKYIITAHHADDNLESIIMHLSRGSNLEGLLGIATLQNQIFRPLLAISKSEIIAYLQAKQIPYRTDQSNYNTKYKRNFIRHKIIPLLKQLNPNIEKTIARNNTNLREIQNHLQTQAKTWIKNQIKNQKFPRTKFITEHPALQKQILTEIHRQENGNNQNLQAKNLTETIQLIQNNIGNKEKQLGKLKFKIKNKEISYQKT